MDTDDRAQNITDGPETNQRHERVLSLIVIAIIALLTGIDYAIILPTAWSYINMFMQEHYAGFVMGILLSVFALSGAIAGVILGYLNDAGFSLKRLILFGCVCQITGNILYFIGINVYVLVISRLIAGVGMGLVPPLLADISRRSTPETRTQLLAKILGCRQIGLFLGPCFTFLFKHFNFSLFGHPLTIQNAPGFVMAILWILVLILTIFCFHDSPIAVENLKSLSNILHNYSMKDAFKDMYNICRKSVIIVLLITTFIAYFNQTTLETLLTPFANSQFNWHELEVSAIFAVAAVEITITYVILHFISKKFSDQSILLFAYIILSIASLIGVIVLPFSPAGTTKNIEIFFLFVGLDIFALPLIVVTTTSLFTQQTNDDQQGVGQGVQRFIVNIATVVGPLFAGGLLPSTWTIICIMFVIVVFATFLLTIVYRSFRGRTTDESSALIPQVNYNDN